MNTNKQIEEVAMYAAGEYFTPEFVAREPIESRKIEGLGIALSKYTNYDGVEILRIAAAALEDCNYHAECETLLAMVEELSK